MESTPPPPIFPFDLEVSIKLTKNIIAIDLAKNVLQVCYISIDGELLSNKALNRQKTKEFLAKANPSIVAVEGCCGCHYWGRYAEQFGHEVRFINPKKLKGTWKNTKQIKTTH